MAKDTEKLIRQLSLISYLMAERRPVTALEIRRDVEGYSGMNEDAFARRFYADRSELESLRIKLVVDRPADGAAEQENYSLRPEHFHLPAIEFTDQEHAALQTALQLLSGEFAYAGPLRLALQQITWGRPSPLRAPEQRTVVLGITASADGHEISARLAKIETAIFRNKTIVFDYYTMERDEVGARRVDPYHLLFQGGEFYLLGHSHERGAIRVFRLSRIRGKVSYATKAEHDFRRPTDFDPREYANRAEWQLGGTGGEEGPRHGGRGGGSGEEGPRHGGRGGGPREEGSRPGGEGSQRGARGGGEDRGDSGVAEVLIGSRIAWQIERHFGRYGEILPAADATVEGAPIAGAGRGDVLLRTAYSSPRMIVSWVLGLGEHARLLAPAELAAELQRRLELLEQRHEGQFELAPSAPAASGAEHSANGSNGRSKASRRAGEREDSSHSDAAIRPERFARLVTLASILIQAGRAGERLKIAGLCENLQLTEEELREDIAVLNVVNFGGGSYVLYAEILEDEGEIEIDPEPYSDNFDRPARLLPVEAKALIAAIDLIGEHIPEGSLASAREKIVAALGEDPMEQGLQVAHSPADDSEVARTLSRAIVEHRVVELDYYKENEDEFSLRSVEPYALTNGREGWYLASFDPSKGDMRHFRLDRIKRAHVTDQVFDPRPEVDPAAEVDGWMRTGEVQSSRSARVWISPERARWARERRRVVDELADGSIVVQLSFAGTDWLVREVLKEAGDAAVLEPSDAREAVLAAVRSLRERTAAPLAGAGVS